MKTKRDKGATGLAPATVTIKTAFGRWDVPRGFGQLYRCVAGDHAARPGEVAAVLRDMLGLIGYEAPAEVVAAWTVRQRVEAEVYAANAHAVASDNMMRRHPKPRWLPEPWRGEGSEDDVWGPCPTLLPGKAVRHG